MSQHSVTPDDRGNPFLGVEGAVTAMGEKDFDAMPKEMLKVFKEVEKLVEKIAKDWGKTLDETKETAKEVGDAAGGGSGGKMSKSLGKFSTPAGKVGMGIMAIGAAYTAMAPNTMDAVTQRMTADTFAGLSGVQGGSRGAIRRANKLVGGGATSAMGPTMAQAALFSSGMAAGTRGANNIMGQMAGMTAFSGMSNQQAAGAVAGLNGMTMLRMGIQIRDSNGEIKKLSLEDKSCLTNKFSSSSAVFEEFTRSLLMIELELKSWDSKEANSNSAVFEEFKRRLFMIEFELKSWDSKEANSSSAVFEEFKRRLLIIL